MMKTLVAILLVSFVSFTGYSQSKPLNTIRNLKDGIKGETTASAKYAAFAEKAKKEGQTAIAKLFEAASKSESIHATNHRKVLTEMGENMESFSPKFEVKTTAENLQSAIDGETYEVTTMYPQFLKEANMENMPKAKKTFTWAIDTEKKHQQFYATALNSYKSNSVKTLPAGYAICPVCGNTFDASKADARCSFCYTGQSKFIKL
jgi:rubrerythrin